MLDTDSYLAYSGNDFVKRIVDSDTDLEMTLDSTKRDLVGLVTGHHYLVEQWDD